MNKHKALDSHQEFNDLQRYFFLRCAAGWDPLRTSTRLWTHDDNMESQALGWVLVDAGGRLTLIPTGRAAADTTTEALLETVKRMAPIDPLCSKAVAALTAQRFTAESGNQP